MVTPSSPPQPAPPLPSVLPLPSAQTTASPPTTPPSDPQNQPSNPKAPKLTNAQRGAAAALRRPNPNKPARDYRRMKYSTGEDNARRYDELYARVKLKGGDKLAQFMEGRKALEERIEVVRGRLREEEREEASLRSRAGVSLRSSHSGGGPADGTSSLRSAQSVGSLVRAGGLQGRIRDMEDRAWKEWLDSLDAEDEKQQVRQGEEQNMRRFEERLARLKDEGAEGYFCFKKRKDVVAAEIAERKRDMVNQGRSEEEVRRMVMETWKEWLDGLDGDNKASRERGGAGREDWNEMGERLAMDWARAHQRYLSYRPVARMELKATLKEQGARLRNIGKLESFVHVEREAWARWNAEWPLIARGYGPQSWVFVRNMEVERGRVRKEIERRREAMAVGRRSLVEIKRMEDGVCRRWREDFPEDAWLMGQSGGQADKETGVGPWGAGGGALHGSQTWEEICWIYNKHRDAAMAVLRWSLTRKMQRMRSAQMSWSQVEEEREWGMWRALWPEVDIRDQEAGRVVWERFREGKRGVLRKQVEARKQVMIAAGKGEAELRWIEQKAWTKWRGEFPKIMGEEDSGDEEESEADGEGSEDGGEGSEDGGEGNEDEGEETEDDGEGSEDKVSDGEGRRGEMDEDSLVGKSDDEEWLAESFAEMGVGESGRNNEDDESVMDTDTEGGVNLAAWGYGD